MPRIEFDRINEQIDIVEHIRKFENLNQEGDRYSGTHNHPDSEGGRCLQITPAIQQWHCFHCETGGKVIEYEKERLNVDYEGAIQSLADTYNIEIPGQTPEQRSQQKKEFAERQPIQELMRKAFEIYHENMNNEQREYFRSRGISDKVIDENLLGYAPPDSRWLTQKLYETTGVKEVSQFLATGLFFQNGNGKIADRYNNRYIFPYWYRGNPIFSIGRSLDPEIESYKKYVKHLVQSQKYPFVSNLAVKHILWGEDNIKPRERILVAEGIVDAILANQHLGDKYTIVSPVTTSWTNAQIERLAQPTGKVKEIIFVADADKAGEKGAITTGKKLIQQWEKIKETNPKAFLQVPNPDTGEMDAYFPKIKVARLRKPPEMTTIDLADYIQMEQIEELKYWIEAAKSLEYEENRLENNPKRFFSGQKHAGFLPKRMADEIYLDSQYFVWTAEQLFHYQNGVYKNTGEQFINARTQENLGELSTRSRQRETTNFIQTKDQIETLEIENDPNILNINNGLFNLKSKDLQPHTPYYHSFTRIPVTYKPDAAYTFNEQGEPKITDAGRQIKRFIADIVPHDCIDLIFEMAGYCLYPNTGYDMAFILTGSGANGKGTLLRVIRSMLGKTNVSAESAQDLSDNRFRVAQLFGKLANICADLPNTPINDSSVLKRIISGDEITGEMKNQKPFDFSPYSTILFSANEVPRSRDRTHAYYRRWKIIPFPNQFDSKNKIVNLEDKLSTPETLSAFFNLAIEGINNVFQRNEFISSPSTEKQMSKYKEANDSVFAFIDENLAEEIGNSVKREDVYNNYKEWCQEAGNHPVSRQKFNDQLPQHIHSAEKTREFNGVKKEEVWLNIKFI